MVQNQEKLIKNQHFGYKMEQEVLILEKLGEIGKNISLIRTELEELKEELFYPAEDRIKKDFIEEVERIEKEGKFREYSDADSFFRELEDV